MTSRRHFFIALFLSENARLICLWRCDVSTPFVPYITE